MMKRAISILVAFVMAFSMLGCVSTDKQSSETHEEISYEQGIIESFDRPNDEAALKFIENEVFASISERLEGSSFAVKSVGAIYVSKEYVDELSYNSKENIFFGYTLSELEEAFEGTRYVFTVDDEGQTIARKFEAYDSTYDDALRNAAIGGGVILVCVVLEVATAGTATPMVGVLALSAKSVAVTAVSAGVAGAALGSAASAIEGNDSEQVLKDAIYAGAEDFKWGAIIASAISPAAKLFTSSKFEKRLAEVTEITTRVAKNPTVKYVTRTVQTASGKLVRGRFPKFESLFTTKLSPENLLAKDSVQFAECNEHLAKAVGHSKKLMEKFTPEQLEQIMAGKTPSGYTWHHNESTGVMQLVDSVTHANNAHTGGRAIWGGGSSAR